MRKQDWALIASGLFYLVFAGPFLWSATDWFLVALGFALGVGLGFWAYKAATFHFSEGKDNA